MKLCTQLKIIAPMSLVLATMGCTAAPTAVDTTQSAMTHEEGKDAELQHDAFRATSLIGHALSKTALSDEQRAAAQRLGSSVSAAEDKVAQARLAFAAALGEQFRKGTFDQCALDDELDALARAREVASPIMRKAFEQLHEMLEPAQRAELVEAMKARIGELLEAAEAWKHALAKDLDLNEEQKTRLHQVIDEAKPKHAEDRAMLERALQAFTRDEFSMEAAIPMAKVADRTREEASRAIARAEVIANILTPVQRIELANEIERALGACERENAMTTATALTAEPLGEVRQGIIARGGSFRAGHVSGWGGSSYTYRSASSVGYATGYPLVGGFGPRLW